MQAKKLFYDEEKAKLIAEKGVPDAGGNLQVGIMIEVPAAAMLWQINLLRKLISSQSVLMT